MKETKKLYYPIGEPFLRDGNTFIAIDESLSELGQCGGCAFANGCYDRLPCDAYLCKKRQRKDRKNVVFFRIK